MLARLTTATGLALAVALGLGLAAQGVMAATYTLSLTGDQGASFAGTCKLLTAAGEETVSLAGPVPLTRSFEGEGLACRLEATGRVVVEIAGGGSRSRSATSGGTINVTVR